MPSPLFHLFAGSAIAAFAGKPAGGRWPMMRLLIVCLFFSIAPDLDAVAGILWNRMPEFHNNLSHSLLFGLIVCVLLLPASRWMLPSWRWSSTLLLTYGCYVLHVVLDWMTYGRGVLLFWPFSDHRFRCPVEVFRGVRWSEGLFTPSHIDTVINELAVIAVVSGIYAIVRTVGKRTFTR